LKEKDLNLILQRKGKDQRAGKAEKKEIRLIKSS
jgi:hypothetical protein